MCRHARLNEASRLNRARCHARPLQTISVKLTLVEFFFFLQCIQSVYTSKIISSDRDLLAVVFYGTEKDKNSVNFKNIYVLQDLDNPGQ